VYICGRWSARYVICGVWSTQTGCMLCVLLPCCSHHIAYYDHIE
jgi:hypothetical protein